MKRIYIDDYIHAQLKKEAEAEGRTLQWWVENKLTGESVETFKSRVIEELPKYYKEFKTKSPIDKNPESLLSPKQEIARQARELDTEVALANPDNQDPDYHEEMNKKALEAKRLWAEWHKL